MTQELTDAQRRIVEELQRLSELPEVDGPPSTTHMDDHGEFRAAYIYEHFENWDAALKAAGLGPSTAKVGNNPIPEDELIDTLHELTDELGHVPSTTELAEHTDRGVATYVRHFGSWSEALDAAGLEKGSEKNRSGDDDEKAEATA